MVDGGGSVILNISIRFRRAQLPTRSSHACPLVEDWQLPLNDLLSTVFMLVGRKISEKKLISQGDTEGSRKDTSRSSVHVEVMCSELAVHDSSYVHGFAHAVVKGHCFFQNFPFQPLKCHDCLRLGANAMLQGSTSGA